MQDPIVTTAPKALKRYMREAARMDQVDPNIAYYCRLHAAKEAMGMNPRPADWLNSVMTKIEATKPADVQTNQDAHLDSIEEIAMNAFGHADDVDRAGNADKKTAMAFNTAATLLQVLQGARGDSFSEELEHQKKYALFKTTDILKCLKQGIRPKPGPPGGEEEEDVQPAVNANPFAPSNPAPGMGGMNANPAPGMGGMNAMPGMSSSPAAPSQPVQPMNNFQPASNFSPPGNNANQSGPDFEKKVHVCSKAEMTMKHAFSAMRFNDYETAIAKLEETLEKLRPYQYT